jgi:hypothetical protein
VRNPSELDPLSMKNIQGHSSMRVESNELQLAYDFSSDTQKQADSNQSMRICRVARMSVSIEATLEKAMEVYFYDEDDKCDFIK